MKNYVILIHGLLRSARSMENLADFLVKTGDYEVITMSYPSGKHNIEFLAEKYLKKTIAECSKKNSEVKINFVTHSMGAILLRYFLSHHKIKNLGRIVMLAPPNNGAKIVKILCKSILIAKIMGPAFCELDYRNKDFFNSLKLPKNSEVGVIAGKYDPKVRVEEAKLDNMKDFLIVPRGHTYIMDAKDVQKAVKSFLENGKFSLC